MAITAIIDVTQYDFCFHTLYQLDIRDLLYLLLKQQSHKQCYFKDKATLANGGDWSQDVYTIAHNGVFVFKMQFNPIITTYTCLPV